MEFLNKTWKGIVLSLIIAVPSWILGNMFPVIGGPVIGILLGMVITIFIKEKGPFKQGIGFVSKKVLQYAVILLGFGLNLSVIMETGKQSLPIIITTIATSLIVSYLMCKFMKIPEKISILIGVGSSICGGSAIAATASVIDAVDEEVAQAISVIFLFNVIAAVVFPTLGTALGFSHVTGDAFGIFAGTAVNDTSSVTAAASTWDAINHLGTQTLDKAVTVKLTRTLAIIPITLALAVNRAKKENSKENSFSLSRALPRFIIYFVLASIVTTICMSMGVSKELFLPLKTLSKFFIVMAMTAIGLNTDIIKLIKTGGKPIVLGFTCWVSITCVSLIMQKLLGIW